MFNAKAKPLIALLMATGLTGGIGLADGPQPVQDTAAQGAKRRSSKTDQLGDPLPEGAIARIGTLRWRTEGDVRNLAFTPDGKMIAATNGGMLTTTQDETIRLFETASGNCCTS